MTLTDLQAKAYQHIKQITRLQMELKMIEQAIIQQEQKATNEKNTDNDAGVNGADGNG